LLELDQCRFGAHGYPEVRTRQRMAVLQVLKVGAASLREIGIASGDLLCDGRFCASLEK
jgi:hypothetical protein